MTSRKTVTITEVAAILGIGKKLAYTLAKQGKLGAIRVGERRIVIPRRALDKILSGGLCSIEGCGITGSEYTSEPPRR